MERRIPQDIGDNAYDLIVVGAGINGAGIARDAAMRGLKVLLLDKEDFGGETTSWSGRLIHGGLRYLEYYEFSLVRESLSDREKLLKMAPHLVRPLPLEAAPAATMRRLEAQVDRRRDGVRGEEGVGELEKSIGSTVEAFVERVAETVESIGRFHDAPIMHSPTAFRTPYLPVAVKTQAKREIRRSGRASERGRKDAGDY